MYIVTKELTPVDCSVGRTHTRKYELEQFLFSCVLHSHMAGLPPLPQIKAELAECLERDGYKSIYEAVGADCRWLESWKSTHFFTAMYSQFGILHPKFCLLYLDFIFFFPRKKLLAVLHFPHCYGEK